jgi:hypothetical protein
MPTQLGACSFAVLGVRRRLFVKKGCQKVLPVWLVYAILYSSLSHPAWECSMGGFEVYESYTGVYQGKYGFGVVGTLFPKPQKALHL